MSDGASREGGTGDIFLPVEDIRVVCGGIHGRGKLLIVELVSYG